MCQRSSNHKLKAIHNFLKIFLCNLPGVSKIVKSQIESNSQQRKHIYIKMSWCVKDRQITNWKQFTTGGGGGSRRQEVCQRSSNHKLKAIHNVRGDGLFTYCGVSKIVKSQIESNSQLKRPFHVPVSGCVKDRQITNWKQFTTPQRPFWIRCLVCQRSSNHKLKAIHNGGGIIHFWVLGVSKIVKSQIESNSQQQRPAITS